MVLMNHRNVEAYSSTLQSSLLQHYYQRAAGEELATKIVADSIEVFENLVKTYREGSVNPVIVAATYQ